MPKAARPYTGRPSTSVDSAQEVRRPRFARSSPAGSPLWEGRRPAPKPELEAAARIHTVREDDLLHWLPEAEAEAGTAPRGARQWTPST